MYDEKYTEICDICKYSQRQAKSRAAGPLVWNSSIFQSSVTRVGRHRLKFKANGMQLLGPVTQLTLVRVGR